MAVPAVLGCHPLIGWRALQSWASVGLFQLSTKGVERRQNQLGSKKKKKDGAERVNATGGIKPNDHRCCKSGFLWLTQSDRKQSVSGAPGLIRALGFRVGPRVIRREREKHAQVSTDHLSLRWFYRLEQVKPRQTAGSELQRSALNTCVCDGAHQ